jgi:selenide,water dikinase
MGPEALAQVLRPLADRFPSERHPELLVGLENPDDAAVLRTGDDEALVFTIDFFPPVVDDPYDYGAIAAANAMSDVFAMGGRVTLALNVSVFPGNLPLEVSAAIVEGGADKVAEAGGVLAGGHTVVGDEPMYGLAVVGQLDPSHMLRKTEARPGDELVLTKPIGAGLVTTALKRGIASEAHVEAATVHMCTLNQAASEAALAVGARAGTDVTGFGLLGHASEMATLSDVGLEIGVGRVPLLPGVLAYAAEGCVPGGTGHNIDGFRHVVTGTDELEAHWPSVLYDPQTSGGLLIAVEPSRVAELIDRLADVAVQASCIGVVTDSGVVHVVH